MLQFSERLLSPVVIAAMFLLAITMLHSQQQNASSELRHTAPRNWVVGGNIAHESLPATPADDDLIAIDHPEAVGALLLADTDIGDRGLAILARTPRLNMLDISNTRATSTSLASLKHLSQLDGLFLTNLEVRDEDLVHLHGLPLTGLNLAGTQVTDAGIADLSSLSQLQYLDLSNTSISDGSIPSLLGLQSLVNLSIQDTDISREGVAAMKAARPRLAIQY